LSRTLLNLTGNNVTLFAFEFSEQPLIGNLSHSLRNHLFGGIGGNPTEALGGYFLFTNLFASLIKHWGKYADVTTLAIKLGSGSLRRIANVFEVGGQNCVLDYQNKFFKWDFFFTL
jgi:hypothetical protein